MRPDGSPASLRLSLGLMVATTVTLALELLFTRFVSLLFNNYEAYWIIGIAMLGFGAGGALVAALHERLAPRADAILPLLMGGIGVTGLLPILLFRLLPAGPVAEATAGRFYLLHLLASIACVIPFLLASLLIALLFTRHRASIGRLYFFDLAGSGAGSFLFLFLLRETGLEAAVLLLASLALAGSLLIARRPSIRRITATLATALLPLFALPLLGGTSPVLPVVPQVLSLAHEHQEGRLRVDFQKWDPVARIDVVSVEGDVIQLPDRARYKILTQDGDAPSVLLGFDKPYEQLLFPEKSLLGIAYWTRKSPSVLIIGLGGGPDVAVAAHFDPSRVTAVEMNRTSIRLVENEFDDFVGGLYRRPDVHLVHDEGRHFVRGSDERYDIIQLTGVDTYILGSMGAIQNLSENYLYTMEAFSDYWDHLAPGGVLSLTYPDFSNWALRALAMSMRLLDEKRIADPGRHLLITMSGGYNNILLGRSPFTASEVEEITRRFEEPLSALLFPIGHRLWGKYLEGKPWSVFYQPRFFQRQAIRYDPFSRRFNPYDALARSEGRVMEDASFRDRFLPGFTPATDDKPFFFLPSFVGKRFLQRFVLLLVLVLLFLLGPLLLFRRRGLATGGTLPLALYFAAIGFAYIAVEMTLLQKFVLYLGHPSYSFAAILGVLLVSSGIGSLLSNRLAPNPAAGARIAVAGIAAATLLLLATFPFFTKHFLAASFPVRLALVAFLVAPLGFFMGIPFPSGVRLLGDRREDFVPWAWGINGSTSVLGSVGGLFLAVEIGFVRLLLIAAAVYILAAIAAGRTRPLSSETATRSAPR